MDRIKVTDMISLRLGAVGDADLIHGLKYQAFLPLYEKYHDDATSPAKEGIEKVTAQLKQEDTDYYVMEYNGLPVGAIRIKHKGKGIYLMSPIYIIPEYQNRGIASRVMEKLFKIYPGAVTWQLDTIKQEKGNCHLYEKEGFIATGKQKYINDKMTLIDYERVSAAIRPFQPEDAKEVARLVQRNFMEVNIKDYGQEAMEEMVKTHDADWVLQLAGFAHMYVFCRDSKIIACGSIASFWGSLEESIILTVFVLPEFHGMGLGRKIIQTLEQDELYIRARRVEIPASITACEFYRKFGYDYKDGSKQLDEEGHYRMEKYKTAVK